MSANLAKVVQKLVKPLEERIAALERPSLRAEAAYKWAQEAKAWSESSGVPFPALDPMETFEARLNDFKAAFDAREVEAPKKKRGRPKTKTP
jgi:hypothetical protein